MKKKKSYIFILGTVLTCLLLSATYANDKVYIDIPATGIRKLVVAVPFFSTGNSPVGTKAGKDMADLLGKALEIYGVIELVNPDRYGGSKEADWKAMGADYVIMGKYTADNDKLTVEGQIFDVADSRLLSGKRYKGGLKQRDDMVLRLADALIEEFTGSPGISRTSIAYISDATRKKEVYVADVLGRSERQVTKHRHLCVSPRYTPDGNLLAYTTYHRGNQDLYITDLRQAKVTRSLSRRRGMNLAPAFSPDGKTMVVTLSKNGSPDLYLMNRKGKILQQLTSRAGINVSASFSPDGKFIVFVSDRSGKPQLYVMNMFNRQVRRLTYKRPENSEPVWSPRGDLIAFSGLVGGQYQLFVMDSSGNNEHQLTSSWGDYESPTWSPDGKMLAFTRTRNGRSDICIMNKNGKNLRVMLPFKGNKSYPQWSPRPQ
ncbi:MAG: Tol-Pal system beta propeller repeat protein TolB [Desulfobulbus propionicus]|nr:MAG: Tol-Pal system beta propeller repeat protein TolB [Desulfobulbus propionicus]